MKHTTISKRAILTLCLMALFTTTTFAGATDYYMGKGRIALSSDGNMHDNDDQLATKMTLMILAKAGLQNKTTLYTYADHVWGSESNDLELMRASAEVTGKRFGFTQCNFIAAVEEPEAAYNAMAAEIAKSTLEDPLFIIAAGPMQVVGEGFDRANKINAEALNHVTVISHSIWNEEHADNYEKGGVHGAEPAHSGWTWKEMEDAFGNRVNFNHISDQNATGTGQAVYKNKDKFSAPNWEKWAWMKNHKDANIRWVRDSKGIHCGPDYSDAGIAYYMVADLDGERGDEFGNPEKLERWVGSEPISTQATVADNFIAIEAENTTSPLPANWALRTPADEKYTQITGEIAAINNSYIEYMAGVNDGLGIKAGNDMMEYTFIPRVSGNYRLTGRMAQQQQQPNGVAKWDQCNDIYVKLSGDFASGNETPMDILTNWQKFYGRGFNQWGCFVQADKNHAKHKLVYALKAGEIYTLSVSGRSRGVCIDYFLFTTEPIVAEEKVDIATTESLLRPAE